MVSNTCFSFALSTFSDGCGRSGTIAAVIFCIERLKVEGIVDVFQTVRMMRTQRPHVIRSLVSEKTLVCFWLLHYYLHSNKHLRWRMLSNGK